MNETITLRPKAGHRQRCHYRLHAGISDEVEQLQPALNLLAHPSVAREAIFLSIAMRRVRKIKQLKQNRRYLDTVFRDSTPWMTKKWAAVLPQRVIWMHWEKR